VGFDLSASLKSAEARFGKQQPGRRRSDRGKHRMAAETMARLAKVLGAHERVPMRQVMAALAAPGRQRRRRSPSRAVIYQFMAHTPLHFFALQELPREVREALYNLAGETRVPAPQVVFYCFNHGTVSAMSFAAGLPWIDLYQAERMRGWRPASLALLRSVTRARGL
jgi:hypothetical protein